MLGLALLIAGDSQNDGSIGRGLAHKVDGGGARRNARFHVGGPTAIHPAIDHMGTEGIMGPRRQITDRHHIGVAAEAKALVGPAAAPTGEKIADAATIHPDNSRTPQPRDAAEAPQARPHPRERDLQAQRISSAQGLRDQWGALPTCPDLGKGAAQP